MIAAAAPSQTLKSQKVSKCIKLKWKIVAENKFANIHKTKVRKLMLTFGFIWIYFPSNTFKWLNLVWSFFLFTPKNDIKAFQFVISISIFNFIEFWKLNFYDHTSFHGAI